jgi:hypothetical protein
VGPRSAAGPSRRPSPRRGLTFGWTSPSSVGMAEGKSGGTRALTSGSRRTIARQLIRSGGMPVASHPIGSSKRQVTSEPIGMTGAGRVHLILRLRGSCMAIGSRTRRSLLKIGAAGTSGGLMARPTGSTLAGGGMNGSVATRLDRTGRRAPPLILSRSRASCRLRYCQNRRHLLPHPSRPPRGRTSSLLIP